MRLITKSYPSLADIYEKTEIWNEELGYYLPDWDYANPTTVACNITSLQPDNSLEQFGEAYTRKVYVKVEFAENVINLRHQVGNLRSKNGKQYYSPNPFTRDTYIFNVSSINTQIDVMGNIVCHVAYLEYSSEMSD